MASGSSARRNWRRGLLGAAILAAVGCAGKDKTEAGLHTMDPRVKAALTTPDGPKPGVPKGPAMGDSNATGMANLTAKDSFNRKTPFLPATPTDGPNLTPPGAGVPVLAKNPAVLTPQRPAEFADFGAPPPVRALDGALPSPKLQDIQPVAAAVPVPNLIPNDVPAPPKQIVPDAAPITPPPAPALTPVPELIPLPLPASDPAGLPRIPSPTEKPIEGLPIAPGAIK